MFTNGLLYAWQCSFNTQLPLKDPMSADERACRRRAREAEWKFRVSKGYEKDTFWNRLKFRMTYSD